MSDLKEQNLFCHYELSKTWTSLGWFWDMSPEGTLISWVAILPSPCGFDDLVPFNFGPDFRELILLLFMKKNQQAMLRLYVVEEKYIPVRRLS